MEYRILIPWLYIIALIVAIVIVCVIRIKWKKRDKKNNRDQKDVNIIDQDADASISNPQATLFCSNCGIGLNLGANFCPNCGYKVSEHQIR